MSDQITQIDEGFGPPTHRPQRPIVVDRRAPWCTPHRPLQPVIDKIGAERQGMLRPPRPTTVGVQRAARP